MSGEQLQRSHARGSVEGWAGGEPGRAGDGLASTEPRSWERGRLPPVVGCCLARRCFNGATLVGAWKVNGCGRLRITASGASTEPRSWERGRPRPRPRHGSPRRRFNGATLVGAWKEVKVLENCLHSRMLQRSHARGSVEGASRLPVTPPQKWLQRSHARGSVEGHTPFHQRTTKIHQASTEPRSWERGRTLGMGLPIRTSARLQRSHARGSVEGVLPGIIGDADLAPLQRSHARGSVEGRRNAA